MPYEIKAKCPFCGVLVTGNINKVEEIFGLRNMGDGRKIPQSYCRKCRNKRCSSNKKKELSIN